MNDWQLYELYTSIQLLPLDGLKRWTRLYPKYVVIMGRAFSAPHPHRHYTFEEFVDKLKKHYVGSHKRIEYCEFIIKPFQILRMVEDNKYNI